MWFGLHIDQLVRLRECGLVCTSTNWCVAQGVAVQQPERARPPRGAWIDPRLTLHFWGAPVHPPTHAVSPPPPPPTHTLWAPVQGPGRNLTLWATAFNDTGVEVLVENCNDEFPFRPTVNPDGSLDCPYHM